MAPQEIDVRASVVAPAARVFALLDDSAGWPRWTPVDHHEAVAAAGPDGLGEVRRFRNGRVVVTERIVERVPGRRIAYTLLAGLAVTDYLAVIDLEERGTTTAVRWHTTFRPRVPGTGWLYRRALAAATRSFVDGLVRAAARDGEPPGLTRP